MTPLLFALTLAGAGPQATPPPPPPTPRIDMVQPPRDPGRRPPPEPVGTAIIRGRVVAADTGSPIRRATVNLSPIAPPPAAVTVTNPPPGSAATAPPTARSVLVNGVVTIQTTTTGMTTIRPRTATTDAQGAFEFTGLPAGSYRVGASPGQFSAAYLSMTYGGKRPSGGPTPPDPGTPIELADGQVFNRATIGLIRGAVIAGRVTDENGDPLARVQVYTLLYPGGAARGVRSGGNVSTDDLGQFRIFGLVPGEYAVAAEARGNTYVQPNAPPETEDEKIGFLTTYYPGTADDAGAQHVRTRAGRENAGIEIRMVSGRMFHVTGMVTDSQGRVTRANGTLFKRNVGGMPIVTSTHGFNTDEQGRFQMRNIPPGNYRMTVRQQPPPGPRVDDGSGQQGEFASMLISVMSDVDDILVTTSPGATIAGTIQFENGPPQLTANQASFQMRVSAMPADPEGNIGANSPQPALVSPDLTFTMKGLAGELLLRSNAPNNFIKAIFLGAEDITDTPREFKTGDRVTIVMTSRTSTVEGTVTDAAGKPTSDALITLFSDDKALWRTTSLRTKRSGADASGHYRLTGLLPGRYVIVAIPRDRTLAFPFNDPSSFEALAKEGTTIVVGEDEPRQVDLKVSAGGGH